MKKHDADPGLPHRGDQTDGPVIDAEALEALADEMVAVSIADNGLELRFALGAIRTVPLRCMLPALQSMDLEVLQEHTTRHLRADGQFCHIYDLQLQAGDGARAGLAAELDSALQRVQETFHAVWDGRAEADGFNGLVLGAGLHWRQVCVLRSYSRYLKQTPLPYSQNRIQRVLLDYPAAARALVDYFEARFDSPLLDADHPQRRLKVESSRRRAEGEIEHVVHIDADRILRAYLSLIGATLRTNAFAPDALEASAPYLVHKLDAAAIDDLPHPRPVSEIFVYSPEFEGLHLRFGLVARGGLRWSDRHDDYRTEVLGLVKAQEVKNSMIVPAGAKGVFIVRSNGQSTDPLTVRASGLRCYRHFISALLDVVDNTAPGIDVADSGVVRHDGPDPYLVVAADKGTATFSDTANDVATRRGYWLGDAFASGGSTGYDHKAMGITARGAWVSGDAHLRTLGLDPDVDAFTVVGIGDMSGDVFGNGMLLRPGITLIAAFDHRHIFVDPQPRIEAARRERQRMFGLPQSSWDAYDRSAISEGGGVWPRNAKTISVSPQMRSALGIADGGSSMTPNELIGHVLKAPVDVFFNGGIGTYVKAADEQHADVADKVNDGVRVDAEIVRARVVVEGGNLGASTRGRIEFAGRGGLINTDAIDNAAGVDCSDHEVNIKIMVDALIKTTPHLRAQRNALLSSMTDEVAEHVLANNLAHNRLLTDANFNASQMVNVYARMTALLERNRDLNRERENLPTAEGFSDLAKSGLGLTTPQLAVLMAHTKLYLKEDLLASDDLDDPHFEQRLRHYFPATLRSHLGESVTAHPLRREIIATTVVNRVVATSGLTYAFRLADETAATTADIVRAHAIVSEIFDLDSLWNEIYSAGLPQATTSALIIEGRRLLDRASRWVLLNRPQPLRVNDELERFSQTVAALKSKLSAMLRGRELAAVSSSIARTLPTACQKLWRATSANRCTPTASWTSWRSHTHTARIRLSWRTSTSTLRLHRHRQPTACRVLVAAGGSLERTCSARAARRLVPIAA